MIDDPKIRFQILKIEKNQNIVIVVGTVSMCPFGHGTHWAHLGLGPIGPFGPIWARDPLAPIGTDLAPYGPGTHLA